MAQLKLKWRKMSEYKYDIYKSEHPGGEYQFLATTDEEEYTYSRFIQVDNPQATGLGNKVNLSWDTSLSGCPETFKIVPYTSVDTPAYIPQRELPWMANYFPSGNLIISNQDDVHWDEEHKLYGSVSLRVEAEDGYSYPHFRGVNFGITDRFVVCWVYISKVYQPDSIMFTFYEGNWNKRVYYGRDKFPFGVEGTSSMLYMGALPQAGCWSPLVIDMKALGITNATGMGFGVYKDPKDGQGVQRGVAHFDSVFTSQQYISTIKIGPTVQYYELQRRRFDKDYTILNESFHNTFIDNNAPDIFGYGTKNYTPNYSFLPNISGDSIQIRWNVPVGTGTEYIYRIRAVDGMGDDNPWAEINAMVSSEHNYIIIKGSSTKGYYPLLETSYGDKFTHNNLEVEVEYYYKLESYNFSNELTSTVMRIVKTTPGSALGFFVLGSSPLA